MQPNLSWRLFLFHDFIFAFKFVVTASTCTGRITAITLVRRYTDIVNIQRIQVKIGTNKRRAMSVTGGAFREPFAGNELLAVFLLPNGRTIPRESSVRTEPCFRMASPTEVRCRLDNLSYCVY